LELVLSIKQRCVALLRIRGKKKLELAYACLTEMETCFLDLCLLGTEVSVWTVELTSNDHHVLLLADFVDCSPISEATLPSHLSLFFRTVGTWLLINL
jgi:hypothetical protein